MKINIIGKIIGLLFIIILLSVFLNKYIFLSVENKINNIKNNTFIIYKDLEIVKKSKNPNGLFGEENNLGKNIGTGFFINKTTFITAGHNISENILEYKITKNNKDYLSVKLEKLDKKNDLAYLKIYKFNNYKKIFIGNILENKNISSIGYNPNNKILEINKGSTLETKNNKIISNINFIKGNSGGPLINNNGEIIGINLNYDLEDKIGISYNLEKIKNP